MPYILGWYPVGTGLRYEEKWPQKAFLKPLKINLSLLVIPEKALIILVIV